MLLAISDRTACNSDFRALKSSTSALLSSSLIILELCPFSEDKMSVLILSVAKPELSLRVGEVWSRSPGSLCLVILVGRDELPPDLYLYFLSCSAIQNDVACISQLLASLCCPQ